MQVSSIVAMEDTPELRLGVRCVLLQLFEHNEKAYRAAVQMMEECGKAAIVHPTGTGKSYIAFKLIEEHPFNTIFWLSPSEYIFKMQLENLKRQAPDISLANVHFYPYAKLMCCAPEELEAIAGLNPTYIILDEFHRVGAERWGASTLELLKLCPDAKILGLSAANIRHLDNNRDLAEKLFDGHIASEMTLGEAIVRGILPAPKCVTTVYQYQKDLTKYQNRIDSLRSAGIQNVNQKCLDALRRAYMLNEDDHVEGISGLNTELREAVHRLFANGEGSKIVTERFEVIEQVQDCRMLFERLQASLSSTGNHYFSEASIYYAEHGNLQVPVDYAISAGLHFGSWVQLQRLIRNGKRVGNLSEQQIQRLDRIGMVWDDRTEFAWKRGLEHAKAYFEVHGNLLVPAKYKAKDDFALGHWIMTKRKDYSNGRMIEEEIRQLDALGMAWNAVSAKWKRGHAEAAAYYEKNADFEVPVKYVSESGLKLGAWISYQKDAYQKGLLSPEQIRRLEQIGMNWGERNYRRWMEQYHAAERYYHEHGNLDIPAKHKMEDGFWLGRWCYLQKKLLREEPGKLRPERIEKLEEVLEGERKKALPESA